MTRRRGIADEQPASLGGWLFADLFLLLIVVGFSAFTSNGDDRRPIVATEAATAVTPGSAVLNGSVAAKKQRTEVLFEWGRDPQLKDARQVEADGSPISGAEVNTPFSTKLDGLKAQTTYYFRAIADNESGKAEGRILEFKTGGDVRCNDVGAQFLKDPYVENITEDDVGDLVSRLRKYAAENGLTDPKVAVAEISGWTTNPSGSMGQKKAKDLYKKIQRADPDQEFFYEDTALSPWQKSRLTRGHFDVTLYLVDLAQKCEE